MREKIVLAGLIVAVMMFAMGCTAVDYSLEGDAKKDLQDSVSNVPISVKLTVSLLSLTEQSTLGSEADLVMEVSLHPSFIDMHNVTANITLPKGIALVSGDTTWSGDLAPGDSVNFGIVVKAGEVGNWTVTGFARWYFDLDNPDLGWYGDADSVCFSVSEDKVTTQTGECYVKPELPPGFGEAEPDPPEGIQPPQPPEIPLETTINR